jgi:hypothetical protein
LFAKNGSTPEPPTHGHAESNLLSVEGCRDVFVQMLL